MTKEALTDKLRQIVNAEKFKLDAAFLCGAATGLPNETLLKAIEMYLGAPEGDDSREELRSVLKGELEKAVSGERGTAVRGDVSDDSDDIRLVYENRDML